LTAIVTLLGENVRLGVWIVADDGPADAGGPAGAGGDGAAGGVGEGDGG